MRAALGCLFLVSFGLCRSKDVGSMMANPENVQVYLLPLNSELYSRETVPSINTQVQQIPVVEMKDWIEANYNSKQVLSEPQVQSSSQATHKNPSNEISITTAQPTSWLQNPWTVMIDEEVPEKISYIAVPIIQNNKLTEANVLQPWTVQNVDEGGLSNQQDFRVKNEERDRLTNLHLLPINYLQPQNQYLSTNNTSSNFDSPVSVNTKSNHGKHINNYIPPNGRSIPVHNFLNEQRSSRHTTPSSILKYTTRGTTTAQPVAIQNVDDRDKKINVWNKRDSKSWNIVSHQGYSSTVKHVASNGKDAISHSYMVHVNAR
ncbi:hypothetical protein RI129_003761 [Pyrocoelia pectoralis]|uniref:Uncharacterized protein n=1 Tax=Pyrocoelia pectoralis TaxID=417401 RepID=A0AAN7VRY6_9COLE